MERWFLSFLLHVRLELAGHSWVGPAKCTVPSACFSCKASPPGTSLRHQVPSCPQSGRRHRLRGGFRKTCRSARLAYIAGNARLAQHSWTCQEGPFGELLRASGPMAKANPFRFSTKYQDDETDLLYYGYRYYTASSGRWLGRDPLGERNRDRNLYAFGGNEPISRTDSLGLLTIGAPSLCWECTCKGVKLGPVGTEIEVNQVGKDFRDLSIGPAVPRSFETEGRLAPHLCKCKYRDSGHSSRTVNGTKSELDWRTVDKPYIETDIPCTADIDYPGLGYQSFPPDTLLNIELTVDMTLTAICDGTDGSHAEATIPVQYSIKLPPFRTSGK